MINTNILKAIELATLAHQGQYRKWKWKLPYSSHPIAVGMLLMYYWYSDDLIVAGILHDIIEDTDYTADDIVRWFWKNVADLVQWMSEDKTIIDKTQRKQVYHTQLSQSSNNVKIICAADMLHNRLSALQELQSWGEAIRHLMNISKQQYINSSIEKFKLLNNIDDQIIHDLHDIILQIQNY